MFPAEEDSKKDVEDNCKYQVKNSSYPRKGSCSSKKNKSVFILLGARYRFRRNVALWHEDSSEWRSSEALNLLLSYICTLVKESLECLSSIVCCVNAGNSNNLLWSLSWRSLVKGFENYFEPFLESGDIYSIICSIIWRLSQDYLFNVILWRKQTFKKILCSKY